MDNFGLITLSENTDKITLLIYLGKEEINYIKSRINFQEINEKLINILILKNDQYWLELRINNVKKDYNNYLIEYKNKDKDNKKDDLLISILLNIPNCINIVNIFSINYYNEDFCINKDNLSIPFIKLVLNIKNKYNLMSISNNINDIILNNKNINYNIKNFSKFDYDETTHLDFEIKILNYYIIKDSILKNDINFNILCKNCNFLISKFSQYCTIAPLPSEMLIHGSEMLTCDNCSPLLCKDKDFNYHDFNTKIHWICIGQYHISIHHQNISINRLIRNSEINHKSIENFFIKDINNIYYNSQRDYEFLNCRNCYNNLGWINQDENQYNFWKSNIIFNIQKQQDVISQIFDNYSQVSLLIHYIERYIKQYSNIVIFDSFNVNQSIKLYILMKNNIKIKFDIFINKNDFCNQYYDSKYNNGDNQQDLNNLNTRFVCYNSIKCSYKICNNHSKNNQEHQLESCNVIFLNHRQFEYLLQYIQNNTLFSNNSSLNLSIFNENFF